MAVAANQHLIVQDLVNLGAQVNTTDCWGRTPLHVCAEKGHSQVLQVRGSWPPSAQGQRARTWILEGGCRLPVRMIYFELTYSILGILINICITCLLLTCLCLNFLGNSEGSREEQSIFGS